MWDVIIRHSRLLGLKVRTYFNSPENFGNIIIFNRSLNVYRGEAKTVVIYKVIIYINSSLLNEYKIINIIIKMFHSLKERLMLNLSLNSSKSFCRSSRLWFLS